MDNEKSEYDKDVIDGQIYSLAVRGKQQKYCL